MDGHLTALLSRGGTPPLSVFVALSHEHILGSRHSKLTVLETMIKNFRKGFLGDYGVKMTPSRLETV